MTRWGDKVRVRDIRQWKVTRQELVDDRRLSLTTATHRQGAQGVKGKGPSPELARGRLKSDLI